MAGKPIARLGRILSVALHRLITGLALVSIVATGVVVVGLAIGYRPVVLLTGSMGETAPPGSLIVAQPRPAESVGVGDILVMRRPGKATVTHRVVDIEDNGRYRFAITKGDANEVIDGAPYALGEGKTELVARWIHPTMGWWLSEFFRPGPALAVVAITTVLLTFQALRWIWTPPPVPVPVGAGASGSQPVSAAVRRRRRRRRLAVGPALTIVTAGVAWALFGSTDVVPANAFSVAGCTDPHLASVQTGEQAHAINGTITVPISAVDPNRSFVMASVRSNSNEPVDSTVQVALAADGASVELLRSTNAGSPPVVDVSWNVVEYACGVLVQRGVATGNGTATVTVPITSVDPSSSFPLVSTAAGGSDVDFDGDDQYRTSLGPGALTIETGGPPLAVDRSFAWQVVSYGNPADAVVQTVDVSLGDGVTTAAATLPIPVDPESTVVLAEPTSGFVGVDLSPRLVRAEMVDGSTVELTRSTAPAGKSVSVRVRTVTLNEGTSVRHGTIDFAPGQTLRTATATAFDPGRSIALSTVVTPGLSAGGRTDHASDDLVGEGSATFSVMDSTTVAVERSASSSNASFGWQAIEWSGPSWWDDAYLYRQRIEVDTTTAAAPAGYTVPVTIDHAALVAAGASETDGSDVRLLFWDGEVWTELDRVVDDGSAWNQATTTINFRTVAAIDANASADYWIYYGNPSPAGPLDNPDNVYLLNEDFESGDLGAFEDRTGGTAWYQADPWTKRIPLTVSASTVAADLTDFPLLVSLTEPALAAAQADGSDIRFVAGDGVTPLDHQIERWNPATGELVAWVRLPVLANAGTSLYLVFGAPNAPDQQAVRTTWSGSIQSAWHLDRDPAGSAPQLDDATENNTDGLSRGAMTAGDLVAGRIGRGVDFDGVDDRLVAGDPGLDGRQALTVSAWVKPDTNSNAASVVSRAGAGVPLELAIDAGGAARATITTTGNGEVSVSGGSVPSGAWRNLSAVWNGTTLRLLVDGAEVASSPASGSLVVSTNPIAIGARPDGSRPFDGVVDEVRVEAVERSTAWIDAVIDSATAPGSFLSSGAVESGSWFAVGPWAARKPLIVDPTLVTAAVDDMALPVVVNDSVLASGALASGADLVFTGADGVTRLDHSIESWDGGTGALRAWVRVPSISADAPTTLYLYYGNGGAVDQQDPVGTFGPEADLVQLGTS